MPHTGFAGRIGIYEMLHFTTKLKRLITEKFDAEALREAAIHDGMKPLRLRGAQKVADGVTTVEEVLRVVPPPTTHY